MMSQAIWHYSREVVGEGLLIERCYIANVQQLPISIFCHQSASNRRPGRTSGIENGEERPTEVEERC